MAGFSFTISKAKPIDRTVKPERKAHQKAKRESHKQAEQDTIRAQVQYVDGFACVEINGESIHLTAKCSSLIGKNSFWLEQRWIVEGVNQRYGIVRIMNDINRIKSFPHPYKYKFREDTYVEGFITKNNEFHVTNHPDKRVLSK